MKNILISGLLFASLISSLANNGSTITDVIVYQRGAKITREATIKLLPGNNEIVIDNLTTGIDPNSLQVKILGDAVLLSASSRVRTLENENIPLRTKTLEDSLLVIDKEISWLNSQKSVYKGEEEIIFANQKLGTDKEKISIDELIQLSEFYRTRLLDIRERVYKINNRIEAYDRSKTIINSELNDLRYSEKKTIGEVVLIVSSKIAKTGKVQISYLTYQAGWTPIYDVRAEGADKPLNLIYKANVSQSTGFNWENVNLTISTGNPTANSDRPMLYPWHIDFEQAWNYDDDMEIRKKAMLSENLYQRSMAPSKLSKEDEISEEIIPYEVTETTNRMSAEYSIEIAQDIPTDGKNHIVAIQQYELNSDFTYHSIPKLDKGAYLLAKVGNYGKFNLLPGPSNLFLDGMYIGQSYLNPVTTVDSMLLSLGKDEKITVKRTQLQNLTSRQIIGGNVTELKGFEISVRNNNAFPIEIEVMDQIPISNNKEIEVKAVELNAAVYDVDYGSLLWKIKLKPGETKMVKFVYSVKYPKDKNIAGL
jgi:uncharacterized protein (TIGR02231 family)